MVVCVDPMSDALKEYGYNALSYFWEGSALDNQFIGWNGVGGKYNSTHVQNKILTGGLLNLFKLHFKDKIGYKSHPSVQFRMLLYPHGRCLLLKPQENQTSFKHLLLLSKAANISCEVHLNVFLMDPVNSPLTFPMRGDHIS